MTCCFSLVLVTGSGSGVGKTWFATRLIANLVSRGFRVAAVKHVHHGVDYRVKDTGRMLEAGAGRVVAIGPGEVMTVERRSTSLWSILGELCSYDVVVVEGFRELAREALERGGCIVYLGGQPPIEEALSASMGDEDAVAATVERVAKGVCRVCLGQEDSDEGSV